MIILSGLNHTLFKTLIINLIILLKTNIDCMLSYYIHHCHEKECPIYDSIIITIIILNCVIYTIVQSHYVYDCNETPTHQIIVVHG